MSTISAWTNELHTGDAFDKLAEMPSDSVHFVMVSPPYYELRQYEGTETHRVFGNDGSCDHDWSSPIPGSTRGGSGTKNDKHSRGESFGRGATRGKFCRQCGAWKGQFGLEPSMDAYIDHVVSLGQEISRVLRPDGNFWLNIGDAYSSDNTEWTVQKDGETGYRVEEVEREAQDKCKMFIPQRIAAALIESGWILRNDCVWKKTNPMPSPAEDRLNTEFEWLFHFTQSDNYYYSNNPLSQQGNVKEDEGTGDSERSDIIVTPTARFSEGHFAVYPEELVEQVLRHSCPRKVCSRCGTPYKNTSDSQCDCGVGEWSAGIALDPMCGRGTTCKVATDNGRRFIGIDISEEYITDIARDYVPDNKQRDLRDYL